MDTPNHDDLHTPDEWADLLDEHALTVASKYGKYDMHNDLQMAAQCIRDQAEAIEKAAGIADSLNATVNEMQRKARAALESLSKLP